MGRIFSAAAAALASDNGRPGLGEELDAVWGREACPQYSPRPSL